MKTGTITAGWKCIPANTAADTMIPGVTPQRLINPLSRNPRKKTSSATGVTTASAMTVKITSPPGSSRSPGKSGGTK